MAIVIGSCDEHWPGTEELPWMYTDSPQLGMAQLRNCLTLQRGESDVDSEAELGILKFDLS